MSELPDDHAKLWLAATFGGLSKHIAKRDDIEIPPGTALRLKRQPHNEHDANAIAVTLTTDAISSALADALMSIAGCANLKGEGWEWHLGFLPAKSGDFNWAAALAPLIDAGGVVEAALDRFGTKKHQICVVLRGEPVAKALEMGAPAVPA